MRIARLERRVACATSIAQRRGRSARLGGVSPRRRNARSSTSSLGSRPCTSARVRSRSAVPSARRCWRAPGDVVAGHLPRGRGRVLSDCSKSAPMVPSRRAPASRPMAASGSASGDQAVAARERRMRSTTSGPTSVGSRIVLASPQRAAATRSASRASPRAPRSWACRSCEGPSPPVRVGQRQRRARSAAKRTRACRPAGSARSRCDRNPVPARTAPPRRGQERWHQPGRCRLIRRLREAGGRRQRLERIVKQRERGVSEGCPAMVHDMKRALRTAHRTRPSWRPRSDRWAAGIAIETGTRPVGESGRLPARGRLDPPVAALSSATSRSALPFQLVLSALSDRTRLTGGPGALSPTRRPHMRVAEHFGFGLSVQQRDELLAVERLSSQECPSTADGARRCAPSRSSLARRYAASIS